MSLLGICVATGAITMLSEKRPGRHPKVGTAYFWSLVAVFVSATLGRMARRQRWRGWIRLHLTGMGLSYILLLTAFLCGQRTQLADLERLAFLHLLAHAWCGRNSAYRSRFAAPSTGSAKSAEPAAARH
jgi:hypothetical protein